MRVYPSRVPSRRIVNTHSSRPPPRENFLPGLLANSAGRATRLCFSKRESAALPGRHIRSCAHRRSRGSCIRPCAPRGAQEGRKSGEYRPCGLVSGWRRSRRSLVRQPGKLPADSHPFHRNMNDEPAPAQLRFKEFAVCHPGEEGHGAEAGNMRSEILDHAVCPSVASSRRHGLQCLVVRLDLRARIEEAVPRGKYVPRAPDRFDGLCCKVRLFGDVSARSPARG